LAYAGRGGSVGVGGGAGGVLFEVVDSGPPVPPDLLPRVFDRFSRADGARSGGDHCGIGLALVQTLSEVLELSASVENAPDGSVSFRIARRGASSEIRFRSPESSS